MSSLRHLDRPSMGVSCKRVGHLSCPQSSLQYADDTLILVPGDRRSLTNLKILLYSFELVSGLSINFSKASIYRLIPATQEDLLAASFILHCKCGNYPFSYFGLPIKPTPLAQTHGQPLLDHVERRLACRRGHYLSCGGCLVLLNPVFLLYLCY